jgi:predicted transcriptional regulator YdeE
MKTNKDKYVVGMALRTSNEEAEKTIPAHWQRFQSSSTYKQITNRISDDIYAVYTNYEGDYTKPYTLIIGFEVSSLDNIPTGFVGVTIPASRYEVYSAKEGVIPPVYQTWKKIWKTPLKRTYKADFELYRADLKTQMPPEVLIYVGVDG